MKLFIKNFLQLIDDSGELEPTNYVKHGEKKFKRSITIKKLVISCIMAL